MKILLACGGGASSGFLAQQIRKAAGKRGLKADVTAISAALIDDYIDDVDILLVGPHLKFDEKSFDEISKRCGVPYMFIDQAAYAGLNGEKVLDAALQAIKKGE